VLAYLLERAPQPPALEPVVATGGVRPTRRVMLRSELEAAVGGVQIEWVQREPRERWIAELLIRRLADGATVTEAASALGADAADAELVRGAVRDIVRRGRVTAPLSDILRGLAEDQTLTEAAAAAGCAVERAAAELAPSAALLGDLTAALATRTAIPRHPGEFLGPPAQGPLRTMPVRFPKPLYQRLKEWSETNNFPMAVVIRGLVERFLDEQSAATE